jgi:hypothetical protein
MTGMKILKQIQTQWVHHKKKILLIFFGLLCLGILFVILTPAKYKQSFVDQIAQEGLAAYLTDLGATEKDSVCWLADPQSELLQNFIGTSNSLWTRWTERRRSTAWSPTNSCFANDVKAIVTSFPLPETVYSLPKLESSALQGEVSEIMSSSGRGEKFKKMNVLFYLQSGPRLMVFSRSQDPVETK